MTVIVAVRLEAVVFAATLKPGLPLPVPLALVSVSQSAVVDALHAQPDAVVSAELLPVEAVAARENVAGDTT